MKRRLVRLSAQFSPTALLPKNSIKLSDHDGTVVDGCDGVASRCQLTGPGTDRHRHRHVDSACRRQGGERAESPREEKEMLRLVKLVGVAIPMGVVYEGQILINATSADKPRFLLECRNVTVAVLRYPRASCDIQHST